MTRTRAFLFFCLGWLIPGLGHFLQKKTGKGVVFCSGVLALLVLGLTMQGQVTPLYDLQPLTLIKFFGSLGNGILFFIMKLAGLGLGNARAVSFDFGTTYIVSAGIMNVLIAINAYEIALKEKHV